MTANVTTKAVDAVVRTTAGQSIQQGIWTLVVLVVVALGGALAWWVRGMPERKRADNEGAVVADKATKLLIDGLTAELTRLQEKVERQDERITALEQENREGVDREREGHDRESALLADNLRLKAIIGAQGEIRQRAQQIVAADRIGDPDLTYFSDDGSSA